MQKYTLTFRQNVVAETIKNPDRCHREIAEQFGIPRRKVADFRWALKNSGRMSDINKSSSKTASGIVIHKNKEKSTAPLGIIMHCKFDRKVFKQGNIVMFKKNLLHGTQKELGEYLAHVISIEDNTVVVSYYEAASKRQCRQRITAEDLIGKNPRFTLKPVTIQIAG